MNAARRACVLAHFNARGGIDDYVLRYLEALRAIARRIVLVSTSPLAGPDLARASALAEVVTRENVGYDFLSYRVGLERLPLAGLDEVIIANDSVFGPLRDLGAIHQAMDRRHPRAGAWGMTASRQRGWHLQSYYVVFRAAGLRHRAFSDFWSRVQVLPSKHDIIEHYEIGLSRRMVIAGLELRSFVPERGLIGRVLEHGVHLDRGYARYLAAMLRSGIRHRSLLHQFNPTHAWWREIIERNGMPFIKRELLQRNPDRVDLSRWREVVANSGYDPELILAAIGPVANHEAD